MATRALGLDENNMHDRKGLSVNAMISLHVEGPRKAVEGEVVSAEYVKVETHGVNVEESETEGESGSD
jgi:hypothetical protein